MREQGVLFLACEREVSWPTGESAAPCEPGNAPRVAASALSESLFVSPRVVIGGDFPVATGGGSKGAPSIFLG